MKKMVVLFALIFAAALVFGCIGGRDDTPAVGNEYSITVSPRSIFEGGVTTIDVRIRNVFENDLENVNIKMVGLPSAYQESGHTVNVGDILPGQEYPIIMTIGAPDTVRVQQIITPKIEVCYEYTTDFFFDSSFVPRGVVEDISLSRRHSSGPISLNVVGFDRVHSSAVTGSMAISNTGIGEISRINKIEIAETLEGSSARLSYSKCTGMNRIVPDTGDCNILATKSIVRNGITATLRFEGIGFDFDTETRAGVDRASGEIETMYCYEIDVGTITVNPIN